MKWISALPVAALATAVPLIARLPPATLRRLLERVGRRERRSGLPDASLEARIERGIALASRIVRPTCLVRGITRYVFFRRAGYDAELAFGMGRPGVDFAGHCWIELGGVPYREARDPRPAFLEMYRVRARGQA